MLGVAGMTASVCSVAVVTVSVVDPERLFDVALTREEPAATAVARPPDVIVATVAVPEVQVTVAVTSCDEPSEYVPVAASCAVTAAGIAGLAGVTAIDCRVGPDELAPLEPPPPQPDAQSATSNIATEGATKIPFDLFMLEFPGQWQDFTQRIWDQRSLRC
jgi:hypothetical protein